MTLHGAVTPDLPATGPTASAAIEVTHLTKLYKTTRAVDGISYTRFACVYQIL